MNNKIKNITIASFEAKDIVFVEKFIENTEKKSIIYMYIYFMSSVFSSII